MAEQDQQNLFRYLQGEISFEQWMQHKQMQEGAGDLLDQSDSDSDVDSPADVLASVSASLMELDVGNTEVAEAEGPTPGPSTSGTGASEQQSGHTDIPGMEDTQTASGRGQLHIGGSTVTDDSDDDVVVIDTETTVKYLTGEMSFEEFYANLEKGIKEEPLDPDYPEAPAVAMETEVEDTPIDEDADNQERAAEGMEGVQPKKRPGRRKGKKKLPKDLQGLMGEANLKFARGEQDEAIKMCMEVIRLAPTHPEPFQTLGMLYEDQGDMQKSLQFSLIAAHLSPKDPEEWVKLAEMSLEQNMVEQAIKCYTKAIKYDPSNTGLLWERSQLQESIGDSRLAMQGYHQLLAALSSQEGEKYLQIARDMAKNYHSMQDIEKALKTMAQAVMLHPKYVTAEDVNLLVELHMSQSTYEKALEVIVQHCGVQLYYADGTTLPPPEGAAQTTITSSSTCPVRCVVPEVMPIDLRVKLVVCFIHLRYRALVSTTMAPMLDENPDEMGDLYLDVAEAFMDTGDYKDAEPLLSLLVHSREYNLPAVWLRYAECLNSLRELSRAVQAYQRVVELVPSHSAARVSLSLLQQQLGHPEEALITLQYDKMSEDEGQQPAVDLHLMLPRCMLLHSQGKDEQFIHCSRQLLFSQFQNIFQKKHLKVILTNRSLKHRIQALRSLLGAKFEQRIRAAAQMTTDSSISVDDLWELFMKLCEKLVELERFEEFERVTTLALMCPQFMQDPQKAVECDFICLVACLLNKNGHFAYNFIRELCVKNINSNRAWNIFSQIINLSQDIRHNRFCMRLMAKHPEHLALGILNGHNAMIAGTYKHALGEYVAAFRQNCNNPMLSLMIGIVFIHMASQKYATKRHSLIVQACSFLNQYRELRGECQEVYYNIGRAMHQIGLLHAAVFYYEKALTLPVPVEGPGQEMFDLRREVAFNLILLYQASGSTELAMVLMQQYCVV